MSSCVCRWDSSLLEWPENDFRIFVGDMGPEVTDEVLCKAFQHFASFQMAKMVKDKRTSKNKGALPPRSHFRC